MLVTKSKKTDYNINISETENKIINHDHDKYIATQEFNQLTTENFAASKFSTRKFRKQK